LNTYIFPAEEHFTPEKANLICPVFFRDLLENGITTAAIYCSVQKESTDVAFGWAEKIGNRAIIGKVMMDRNAPSSLVEDTDSSIRESEEVCRRWHGVDDGRLLYAFTPRFAPTCSRELMESAGACARERGAYIQTHLAENQDELQWVMKLFPEAANYTDVYRRAGLLSSKSVLAHAIYLAAPEREALAETGSCLSHCPTSNLFLKSGLMPLYELMNMGLRIGLGSDVAGGPTLSPFAVMRGAIYVHNARKFVQDSCAEDITPATALYLATLGGAEALHLEDRIGSLDPGKEGDFVVIDAAKLSPVAPEFNGIQRKDALLSRLVFRGDDRIVEQTYVRGKLLHDRCAEESRRRRARWPRQSEIHKGSRVP
jgi:guanine deaminase